MNLRIWNRELRVLQSKFPRVAALLIRKPEHSRWVICNTECHATEPAQRHRCDAMLDHCFRFALAHEFGAVYCNTHDICGPPTKWEVLDRGSALALAEAKPRVLPETAIPSASVEP